MWKFIFNESFRCNFIFLSFMFEMITFVNMNELFYICFQVDIVEGELICPETNRKFPISEGIPNMLIKEDEL